MTPILYAATETAFTRHGICALVDATRCVVIEDREGQYMLEMDYPTTGRFFDEIKINRIILAQPAPKQNPEPFDIYSISANIDGVVTFYARHVKYRLEKTVFRSPGSYDSGQSWFLNILFATYHNYYLNTPRTQFSGYYTMGSGGYAGKLYKLSKPIVNAHEFLTKYKDLLVDVDSSATNVAVPDIECKYTKFYINIYDASGSPKYYRGKQKPIVISVGRDVKGVNYELDYSNVIPHLIPYWTSRDEPDAPFLITSSYEDSEGYIHASPYESCGIDTTDYSTDVLIGGWDAAYVDLSREFDEQPDQIDLYKAGVKYIKDNSMNSPYANLTIDYTEIDKSLEPLYTFSDMTEPLLLCDSCTVIFSEVGLSTVMKVVKCTYNVLLDRYDKLEFGSMQRTLYNANSVSGTAPESTGNVIIGGDYSPTAGANDDGDVEIDPDDIDIID